LAVVGVWALGDGVRAVGGELVWLERGVRRGGVLGVGIVGACLVWLYGCWILWGVGWILGIEMRIKSPMGVCWGGHCGEKGVGTVKVRLGCLFARG